MHSQVNSAGSAGLDDPTVWGSPAFIERDQFVYFVTLAHELGDPADWPAFRRELVAALTAAWGLDAVWSGVPTDVHQRRHAQRQKEAFALVDEIRARHDPVCAWEAFFDALWDARGPLRDGR